MFSFSSLLSWLPAGGERLFGPNAFLFPLSPSDRNAQVQGGNYNGSRKMYIEELPGLLFRSEESKCTGPDTDLPDVTAFRFVPRSLIADPEVGCRRRRGL